MKKDILSLCLSELKAEELFMSLPSFRASQVFEHLHKRFVSGTDEMNNIPKALREEIDKNYLFGSVRLERKEVSKKDGTVKYLFSLYDGELVETVLLRSNRGLSVCLSTEVGCKMGCRFCASGKLGFTRRLTAGEMLSQVYFCAKDSGERIGSCMLMGIGEPLDNYDEVLKFIKLISSENGMNLSQRHISVSTCGLVPEILRLAEEKLQITLSLSLHAPFDDMRSEMMPINDRFDVKTVISACDEYLKKTGRRISVEYTVIKNKNDSESCAEELKKLLGGKLYHINLITLNEIKEKPYEKAGPEAVYAFQKKLLKRGLNATVRRRLGDDISAACGQLRRDSEGKERSEDV